MQGPFVSLCYTMENHAIATTMTYFGSTEPRVGNWSWQRAVGGTSSKNRLVSPVHHDIYIYMCVCVCDDQ